MDKINLETLLFQTGYLTIDKVIEMFGDISYILKYPNQEVKNSLNKYIFAYLSDINNIAPLQEKFYNIIKDE